METRPRRRHRPRGHRGRRIGAGADDIGVRAVVHRRRKLRRPDNYREWIYLSTGLDMNYRERADGHEPLRCSTTCSPNHPRTARSAKPHLARRNRARDGSAAARRTRARSTKSGHFQTADLMGMEVHVRDARFPGGWAFFVFDNDDTASPLPAGRFVLCVPPRTRRGRHDVRAVLSDAARACAREAHAECELPRGRGETPQVRRPARVNAI